MHGRSLRGVADFDVNATKIPDSTPSVKDYIRKIVHVPRHAGTHVSIRVTTLARYRL